MSEKPSFSVAVVGLDAQHLRLIEIVFRHIQYNRYVFRLADPQQPQAADVLIAGVHDADGRAALERARGGPVRTAAIAAVDGGRPDGVRHAIEIGQLVRQLLPILNRVVEIEGLAPRAAPAAAVLEVGAAPAAARPKVLVVDDSATVRTQLTGAFDRMGVDADAVGSRCEALHRLAQGSVDLAMLDIVLPDGDGLQLARSIRNEPRWKALPIVVLSARRSPLDVVRGAAAGCSAFLAKPVAFADLHRTVARHLGRALDGDAMPATERLAFDPPV